MSIGKYQEEKNKRYFYVQSFRMVVNFFLVFSVLNVLFFLMVVYFYYAHPQREYYSSNGVTFPVKLTPLKEPNYLKKALLPDDIPKEKLPDVKF